MQAERLNIDEFNSNINRFRHDESLKQSLHFDDRLDEVLNIVEELLLRKGGFHLVVRSSSSQFSCCTFDNPYSFQLFTEEEVFSDVFMQHFVSTGLEFRPVSAATRLDLYWMRLSAYVIENKIVS